MRVYLVPVERLIDHWPVVGPLLQRATDRSLGRYLLRDLLKKLQDGDMQLWVACQDDTKVVAAMTTTITTYPQCRALTGIYIAGDDAHAWGDAVLGALTAVARETGCSKIEFIGRPGWKRWVEPLGFKHTFSTYEKQVT